MVLPVTQFPEMTTTERLAASPASNTIVFDITLFQWFIWNGSVWSGVLGLSPTNNYFSGYMPNSTTWSTTSTTLVDPTVSGTNTLTTRNSNGLSVVAAASNLPGITITPNAVTSAYNVSAIFGLNSNGEFATTSLFDGTNIISSNAGVSANTDPSAVCISGIWVPGTTSPSTIKIQLAITGTTASIMNGSMLPGTGSIEWTLFQIN